MCHFFKSLFLAKTKKRQRTDCSSQNGTKVLKKEIDARIQELKPTNLKKKALVVRELHLETKGSRKKVWLKQIFRGKKILTEKILKIKT